MMADAATARSCSGVIPAKRADPSKNELSFRSPWGYVVLITIVAPTATKECTSQTGAKKDAQILTLRECLPGLSYGQHLSGRQGLLWKARRMPATRVQEKVAV